MARRALAGAVAAGAPARRRAGRWSAGAASTTSCCGTDPAAWTRGGATTSTRAPATARAVVLPGQLYATTTGAGRSTRSCRCWPEAGRDPQRRRLRGPARDRPAVDGRRARPAATRAPRAARRRCSTCWARGPSWRAPTTTARAAAPPRPPRRPTCSTQLGRPSARLGRRRAPSPRAAGTLGDPASSRRCAPRTARPRARLVRVERAGAAAASWTARPRGSPRSRRSARCPTRPSAYAADLAPRATAAARRRGRGHRLQPPARVRPSRLAQNAGPMLAAGRGAVGRRGGARPVPARGTDAQTVAVYGGDRGRERASSPGFPQFPEHRPFAALDGDPATHWLADRALTPRPPRARRRVRRAPRRPVRRPAALRRPAREGDRGRDRRAHLRGARRLEPPAVGLRGVPRCACGSRRAAARPATARAASASCRSPACGATRRCARRCSPSARCAAATSPRRAHLRLPAHDRRRSVPPRPLHGGLVRARSARPRRRRARPRARLLAARRAHVARRRVGDDRAADGARRGARRVRRARGGAFNSSGALRGPPGFRASSAFDGTPRPLDRLVAGRAPRVDRVEAPRDAARADARPGAAASRRPTRVRLRSEAGASPPLDVGPDGAVRLPAPVSGRRFRLEILRSAFPRARPERAAAPGGRHRRDPRRRACRGCTCRARARCGRTAHAGRLESRPRTLGLGVEGTIADLDAGRPLRARGCDRSGSRAAGDTRLVGARRDVHAVRAAPALAGASAPPPRRPAASCRRAGEPRRPRGRPARADRPRPAHPRPRASPAAAARAATARTSARPSVATATRRPGASPATCRDGDDHVRPEPPGERGLRDLRAGRARAAARCCSLAGAARRERDARCDAPASATDAARGARRLGRRRAALVAVPVGARVRVRLRRACGPLFALGVFLVLWRGIGAKPLALPAGLLGVAVPVLTLLIRPEDRGGYNPEYAIDRIAVHWVAVAGVALFVLALSRAMGRPGRARSAPPSGAAPPAPAP